MPKQNGSMAFIQKLIQNSKFSRQSNRKLSTDEIRTDWRKPQFNSNAIRIVLFTDSDIKGRKLIFDSKAVVREEPKGCKSKWGRQKLSSLKEGSPSVQSPGSTNQKGLPRYEYQKTGSDIKMLEEMMFGAEGMAYKGTSLKVHVIRSPAQLMLTKVFIPERPKRSSTLELDDSLKQKEEPFSYWSAPDLSAPRNISDSGKHSPGIAHSVPMDVPSPKQSWLKSIDLIDEDSGLASLQSDDSYQTPFPSPGSSYTGSCNSLNSERRWRRIQSTSLESFSRRQSQHDIIAHEIASPARQKRSKLALGIMFGTIDESNDEANRLFENFFFSHMALFEGRLERLRLSVEQAYYSGRTHLDIMIPIASPARQKRSKLALGIMFGTIDESNDEANRLFENFFFSHMALFEGRLERLRLSVEQAYYSGRTHLFLDIMIHAFESFKMDIQDLYTAPRLSEPVWLNMMSFSSYRYILCEKFLHEFMGLVIKHDNKNTNFFMSTLVTAVLTYHLAWVPTVMPAGGVPSNTYLDKHSAKWVDTLAKSHPYNPLWAQLGDLYGSIGFPLKLSRTVVVGKKADLVKKILYILSYFIRCSDVLEATEWGSLEGYMKMLDFTESSVDAEKTPTPANSYVSLGNLPVSQSPRSVNDGFTSLNPDSLMGQSSSRTASGGNKFEALNIDSVENDCNSNHSGDVGVKANPCTACNANRNSNTTENKFGKSVFYLDSKACSCDNLTNSGSSTGPNPTESSNLEKGKSCESLLSKKRSLSLKLDIPNSVESRCENHMPAKTVTPDTSLNECRLSVAQIVEDTKVHNVQHVRKSSDFDMRQIKSFKNDNGLNLDALKRVGFTGSDTKLTAQQYQDCIGKVMSKEEMKAAFLKKGSDSMFDEYFKDDIETKTIDDLDEKDLVHELRPVNKQRHTSGSAKGQDDLENSIKAPSMPDLSRMKSDSSQSKLESEKSHRSRLGSLDQSFRSRKKSFNRQISESGAKAMKGAPGRCRPVTPTELSRRRHMSSTSTIDFDTLDPRAYCRELPMPWVANCDDRSSQKCFNKNFGRSLLADYSDHYMSDFVLHGTSDRLYQDKMIKDVRMATQYSVLDEPIAEAVCVVADTDQWTVNVCSSQYLEKTMSGQQQCVSSQLVSSMLESVLSMWKLKMSPEFCMMHLEDRLQEIYFKSKMMAEYLKGTKNRNIKELIAMLGFDRSDLPLLVAIAGTHTPNFPLVVLS